MKRWSIDWYSLIAWSIMYALSLAFWVAIVCLLGGCGGDARHPLADGSAAGPDPVGTLGSLGSWILIAGGTACTLATIGFGLSKWFAFVGAIPGIRTILGAVEVVGGCCIIVGTVLEWLDAHRGYIIALVALYGLLVAVRYRVSIYQWLRIGPAPEVKP